jgi:hypothetical protein
MEITKCIEFYKEYILIIRDNTGLESIKKICFKFDDDASEWGFISDVAGFYTPQEIEKINSIMNNINKVSALSKELRGMEKL